MERLTDSKVAANLKSNYEALQRVGIEPSPEHLQYVRLSELEDALEKVEELTQDMDALTNDHRDPEDVHIDADDILCKALKAFGCTEIVNYFENIYKYYA